MKATEDDVRHAYRLLLGREPDAAGMATYSRMLQAGGVTPTDLTAIFMGSSEFVARVGGDPDCVEVEFHGYHMYVRTDDLDLGVTVRQGTYEPHVTAAVRECLYPGASFIDIGANIGYYTALAAHLVGSSGSVFAVEPMDKNVQLIYRTVWKNRFRQVQVFPFAASDATQLLPMATTARSSNGEVLPLDTRRIPSLFAQGRAVDDLLSGLPRLDLVKLDIEGHEPHAWRGFVHTLEQHRPVVLSEFHPKCLRDNGKVDPSDYLAVLFAYGSVVEVLVDASTRVRCDTPAQVMQHWAQVDRRSGDRGETHLDLLIRPRLA